MKSLIAIFIFLTLFSLNTHAQSKATQPSDLKLINACGAEFYVSSEIKEESIRGIDSCIRKYMDTNNVIMLDVLGYITPNASRKDEYSDERNYKYKKTKIDGRKAEIITYYEMETSKENKNLNFVSILFVPQMRKDGGNLTIWINSKTVVERDKAMKIFQSVRFRKD